MATPGGPGDRSGDRDRLDGTASGRPGAELDQQKVAAARLWATSRLPYLASPLFAATVRAAPGSNTIAADRAWRIHADPAVVDGLAVDELGRMLVHLVGHLVRDHAARAEVLRLGGDTDRARWNRCADAELNDDLRADDCVPSVAGDLPADLGCADGDLAEVYYRAAAEGARRWDCGSGADGRPRPWDGPPRDGIDPGQCDLLRLGVAADLQRRNALQPGTIPGGWLRWAEAVLPSRTDWRRLLAAEIRRAVAAVAGSVDYTYARPPRRGRISPRVILPSLYKPIPEVAVVCDTSGSMSDDLLARALTEVEALLTRTGLRATKVRVLAVDTAVHAVRRVSRATQVELAGGGGTDMGAGIAAAAALRPRPSLVVVLTDGFTPWPDAPPPGIRVIVGLLVQRGLPADVAAGWAAPPWARTVLIDDGAA